MKYDDMPRKWMPTFAYFLPSTVSVAGTSTSVLWKSLISVSQSAFSNSRTKAGPTRSARPETESRFWKCKVLPFEVGPLRFLCVSQQSQEAGLLTLSLLGRHKRSGVFLEDLADLFPLDGCQIELFCDLRVAECRRSLTLQTQLVQSRELLRIEKLVEPFVCLLGIFFSLLAQFGKSPVALFGTQV